MPSNREHYHRLDQRCKWLTERIAAKVRVGWDVYYDTSERDALLWALELLRDLAASRGQDWR